VKQHVHRRRRDGGAPFPQGDEAILDRMRDFHRRCHADDARGTLDRVCRPHQGLKQLNARGILLKHQQPVVKRRHVRLNFSAEELEQSGIDVERR
jgi:hypothetical protein